MLSRAWHRAANADGELETLGVTGWHKFYDEAEGWQSASELTIGDTLRGLSGENVKVVALAQRPATERVYNMTVEADHVYFVGDLTTLTRLESWRSWESPAGTGSTMRPRGGRRLMNFRLATHFVGWQATA